MFDSVLASLGMGPWRALCRGGTTGHVLGLLALACWLVAGPARAADAFEEARAAAPAPPTRPLLPPHSEAEGAGPLPFGSRLFAGNFLHAREDGVNANYRIMPGDHVALNSWGSVQINQTFVVDGQGNIFVPEIGPIHLAGVRNAELTAVVESAIKRVYTRYVSVYTNLITAKPVGVFVTGGVRRPGRYGGVPSDSILFFLDQAGGIDAQLGSYRSIDVLRDGQTVRSIDLYDFLLEGRVDTAQFQEGDVVLVHRRGPVVLVGGDVSTPSWVEFKPGAHLGSDALGIIAESALATNVTVSGIRGGLPFQQTLPIQAFAAFQLQDGDSIVVRQDLTAQTISVKVAGETLGPGTLSVRRGARLVDVLNHIPVDPTLADVKAIHLRRVSVAQAQKDSIEDGLFRLERSALLALSSSNGESDIRVKEADLTRKFVERARLIQPIGRVVTTAGGAQQNIILEPNDTIVIPSKTNVVRVSGEVLMAQAVMYQEGLRAEDYVEMSGGFTDRADTGKVIVLRANAEVHMGDLDAPIRPGDEILVPPEVDTKYLQNVADITQIIYQVAVAAAVVLSPVFR